MRKLSEDIFAVGNNAIFVKTKDATHTVSKFNTENSLIGNRWLPWGDNNLYPQELAEKLKKSGTAVGGLEVLTSAHFGTGFKIYKSNQETADSDISLKEILTQKFFPEIHQFLSKTKFNIFISEIIQDYETFRVAFPEYLLSPNGDQIISVKRHQASFCRFEVRDSNGIINNVGINTDWENYKDENTSAVPCFGSNVPIDEIKAYCKQKNIRKFIIPVIDALLIEKSYPSVGWHASFRNGWIDVVLSIPAYKKAMFKKQLHIKYVIHVADDYFAHYYKDTWTNFTDAEKNEARKKLVDLIDANLKGDENGGSSITSPFFRDRETGKEIKGIQVEPITQPNSEGDFLSDGFAGNNEILFAMGVDPSLLGSGTPGSKNLSGSGSDKREAYTILCSRLPIKHARTLQIFENIKFWNNWDDTLVGKFPNVNLTTLDKNPNGVVPVVN